MGTAIYAGMHFLVDFLCAWAMFGFFQSGAEAYGNFLIYNFCAFALQMPLGTLLDLARGIVRRKDRLPLLWTGLGVILTVLGALFHPAVLGLGNALFHVGGGLDVITEDFACNRKGRNLGIFVAPGAIGLFFGTLLGKTGTGYGILILGGVLLAALFVGLLVKKPCQADPKAWNKGRGSVLILTLCCFTVVALRSWTGFAATFPWRSRELLAVLAVLAVAGGKALGGFASGRFGPGRTMGVTLGSAAVCFLLGDLPVFGLLALLLFNMSMPVTLYLLAENLPKMPGFSFGLLTFGLFLGFLPSYSAVTLPISGTIAGMAGSLISALLMLLAWKAVDRGKLSS